MMSPRRTHRRQQTTTVRQRTPRVSRQRMHAVHTLHTVAEIERIACGRGTPVSLLRRNSSCGGWQLTRGTWCAGSALLLLLSSMIWSAGLRRFRGKKALFDSRRRTGHPFPSRLAPTTTTAMTTMVSRQETSPSHKRVLRSRSTRGRPMEGAGTRSRSCETLPPLRWCKIET